MPSVAERLATLEAGLEDIRHDVRRVLDVIDGGDGVQWERSVRGRLHTIETNLAGIILRRSAGIGMLKGWQSVVLVACAVATAAAAWYAAVG